MAKLGRSIHNAFVWTFERGTLQYDILCALILAFVFLVPRSCFEPRKAIRHQVTQDQAEKPPPEKSSLVRN